MAQWVARLATNVAVNGFEPHQSIVSLSKKRYCLIAYCLVLVGSRKGFERDFTIKLK